VNASNIIPLYTKRKSLSALHETAQRYAETGIPVFICYPDAKIPATPNGFKDATTDLRIVDGWYAVQPNYNLAICPEHAGWGVIDLESDCPPDWANGREMPETYTVSTPRGGKHLYFEGSIPSSVRKLIKGLPIDTRGFGGYVLVPPSVVGGRPYKLERDLDLARLPEWISKALTQPSKVERAPDVPLDLQANVWRAVQYLKNLPPVVEGQGSDNAAYTAAAMMHELGLSEGKAFEVMREHFKCTPLTDDWLLLKIKNGFEYAQNAAGASATTSAQVAFGNVIDGAAKRDSETGPIPFADLLQRQPVPVQEIIPGLVEKGIATFLAGPGGTHKSRVALQWGLSLAAGMPVFGRQVERCTFVHLSHEDHPDEIIRRTHKITGRLELPPNTNGFYWDRTSTVSPLAIVSDDGFAIQPFWHRLHDYLRGTAGHKFVVCDSTYNVLEFAGQAKVNEAAVKGAIEAMNRLCQETDSTILMLWHPSQAGLERGDASGWSVAWHNAPRARLSLTAVKDTPAAFDLKVEKRNNGPTGERITLYWSEGVLLPRSEVDSAQQSTLFTEACIDVALMAAERDDPIQKQRKLYGWQIDEIDRRAGFRPTEASVKEELARAISAGRLRYVKGHGRDRAGYFPKEADIDGTMPRKVD
jgi:RecA-family ATPase